MEDHRNTYKNNRKNRNTRKQKKHKKLSELEHFYARMRMPIGVSSIRVPITEDVRKEIENIIRNLTNVLRITPITKGRHAHITRHKKTIEDLKQFYQTHHDIPKRCGIRDKENSLAMWIVNRRVDRRKNRLSAELEVMIATLPWWSWGKE